MNPAPRPVERKGRPARRVHRGGWAARILASLGCLLAARLVAAVTLKDLGLVATAGLKTKGDVGVLFSNDGGTVTARRTYYFNQNTSITGYLPSEAQLQPANWGTVEVE
ncbi:MAG: hypothetical protein PHR35_03340 [Kiritimatiellae bacterium]|nr:hypothetical protein [Kiritimatiellia bacterium]